MSDVAKRLNDLWEIEEIERQKGIKLLQKIYGNILANPNDPKFRDLNFSKIRKKLDKCRPAFYLLFTAGFSQSVDGQRLQWQNNKITVKQLQTASNGLNAKISGQTVDDGAEYGGIVAPEETEVITGRNMMIHKKKKEKERALKQAAAASSASPSKSETESKSENQDNSENQGNPENVENAEDIDPEELKKAMAMSMDQNGDNPETADNDGDVEMESKDELADELAAAGLSADDLELLQQIKAAKGITVTLKVSDLKGLSKEEKIAKFKETQEQYRKEKKQNKMKGNMAREKARREGIKKQQEAERKRKEYELRMVSQRKAREKADAKRRKQRIKEKIAADKVRRAEQREREKRKRDAEKAAKVKAAEQQEQ